MLSNSRFSSVSSRIAVVGIVLGAVALVAACKKGESVPVGGECDSRDDCQKRNDCLKVASGKSYCTQSCIPSANDCPAPTKCQTIDLTVSQGSQKVGAAGIPRCLP